MFDDDGWGDFDAAATLDAAVEFDLEENRAALGKLQAALHFADLHATLPTTSRQPGGERLVVYGGDGCPAIAEFAPAEFGALLKLSSGAAAAYIGEALALRHRLPRIWTKTLNGQAIVWRARAVARACLKLTAEAAALVDERIVAVIDTVSAYRLHKIVEAAIKQADPEAAHRAAEQHARERGVWVQPTDNHGTKTIWVKAAAGDVIRFDATINDLAQALHKLGDTDPLPTRRAKAIGWIADPTAAHELLAAARYLATHPTTSPTTDPTTEPVEDPPEEAPTEPHGNTTPHLPDHPAEPPHDPNEPGPHDEADRDAPHPSHTDQPHPPARPTPETTAAIDPYSRHQLASTLATIKNAAHNHATSRPRVVIYAHLTDHTLTSREGIIRVENHGPLLLHQLKELLGHDQVTLQPVIDLNQPINVNAYEIPTRIREHVRLTHPIDTFPYGTTETTPHTDLDHIHPYHPHGPPGQTSTTNLTPTTRYHHRVKTHGQWKTHRTNQGALQWTMNHPGFDAHLLRWEGGSHAEQVRRADPGQGGPSGHRAR